MRKDKRERTKTIKCERERQRLKRTRGKVHEIRRNRELEREKGRQERRINRYTGEKRERNMYSITL